MHIHEANHVADHVPEAEVEQEEAENRYPMPGAWKETKRYSRCVTGPTVNNILTSVLLSNGARTISSTRIPGKQHNLVFVTNSIFGLNPQKLTSKLKSGLWFAHPRLRYGATGDADRTT